MKHKYKLNKKQKKSLLEILVTLLLFITCLIIEIFCTLPWKMLFALLYLVPYLVIGWRVLYKATRNLFNGQVFDENFLMCIATIGAFIIGEYPEAVFVMLFYCVGELFEQIAVGKSRGAISKLMEIRPDSALVERDGERIEVSPEDVKVGEIIVVMPGERVSLDGEIVEGTSSLNTVALTGESMPRDVDVGDNVISGSVNMSGLLRIRVSKPFGESTVSKILALVESTAESKSKCEDFITKFARIYTPVVVICALALAVIPPIFIAPVDMTVWSVWIYRAMSFLVISCPCALVISVPMTFFGGIGRASSEGILIKGSNCMESLARCNTIVFDKTGTLTEGSFSVSKVVSENGFSEEELLQLAASAESCSNHPIACALRDAVEKDVYSVNMGSVEELAGRGVRAICGGREVYAGNQRLMEENGIEYTTAPGAGSVIYVSVDGIFAGFIIVSDSIRKGASDSLNELRNVGVRYAVMLTGDRRSVAESVAASLGIDECHSELLPDGKTELLETLQERRKDSKDVQTIAVVGDGINDAPMLACADIGIAMGGIGSDAAIEAADVVLMEDRLDKIPRAIDLSRRTLRIVKENITVVLAVKAAALLLGAFGITGMWFAAFADVGISVLAILNSLKIFKA